MITNTCIITLSTLQRHQYSNRLFREGPKEVPQRVNSLFGQCSVLQTTTFIQYMLFYGSARLRAYRVHVQSQC